MSAWPRFARLGWQVVTLHPNIVALLYLVASVFFILALRGLSHPETARKGNRFGIIGMVIAILTTFAVTQRLDIAIGALVVGGAIGWFVAHRVEMTQMPELVAAMHSLVGMAAVLIAAAVVNNPTSFGLTDPVPIGNRVELFIGTFVGAITFSGSIIAFGKLAGLGKSFRLFSSAPVGVPRPALGEPAALRRDDRLRLAVRGSRSRRALDAVPGDDRHRVRARRAHHHPHRRRGHAGRDLDAEQLLRAGRRRASASR